MIVAKFGGSSLADATQFRKVRNIILADSRRKIVVPSAPGRRFDGDDKVTDLLYRCHSQRRLGQSFMQTFGEIRKRFCQIANELELSTNLSFELDTIEQHILQGASADFCASRGEYLNGLLLAEYLGFAFLDAAEAVFFSEVGVLDREKTTSALQKKLGSSTGIVLSGFYGSKPDGSICVFTRGGSDISGALAACAVSAELYENWTDVSGFLMADPRIVNNPHSMSHITYHEMYELSCAGATVLHEDSVFPVSHAGIPTNILNINLPNHPGTMITCTAVQRENFAIFAGIAGKKGFSLLIAEKEIFDRSPVFGQQVIQAAKDSGLTYQYLSSGTNSVCLIVNTEQYKQNESIFKTHMSTIATPHTLSLQQGFAAIVLVGYGIIHNYKTVNRIYTALCNKNISIAMLNQGGGELSTWVSVAEHDMEAAIRTLYEEFA